MMMMMKMLMWTMNTHDPTFKVFLWTSCNWAVYALILKYGKDMFIINSLYKQQSQTVEIVNNKLCPCLAVMKSWFSSWFLENFSWENHFQAVWLSRIRITTILLSVTILFPHNSCQKILPFSWKLWYIIFFLLFLDNQTTIGKA